MRDRFMRVTDTFTAHGDDGKTYLIYVFTEILGTTGTGQEKRTITGKTCMKTLDDREVFRVANGTYEIASTGVTLTSDALNAP